MSTEATPIDFAGQLGQAVRRNDIIETQRLLSMNVDVNCLYKYSRTPLYFARSADMVKLLLSQKAKINISDAEGMRPLHTIVMEADFSAVRVLLDAKADVNVSNSSGRTPLVCSYEPVRVSMLIAANADVNARDKSGNMALHSAVRDGHPLIVKILLDSKADVWARYDSRLPIEFINSLNPLGELTQEDERMRALLKSAMNRRSAVTMVAGYFKKRRLEKQKLEEQKLRPLSRDLNKIAESSLFERMLIPEIFRYSGHIPPKDDLKEAKTALAPIERQPLEAWQILRISCGSAIAEESYETLWKKLEVLPLDPYYSSSLTQENQDPSFLHTHIKLAKTHPDRVLRQALVDGNHYLARMALHFGADINSKECGFDQCAIVTAATNGYAAVIDAIMISNQVLPPKDYAAAVDAAVTNGHRAALAVLLSRENAIRFYNHFRADTALALAKDKGDTNIIALVEQYRNSRSVHFKLIALDVRGKSLKNSACIATQGAFAHKPVRLEESLANLRRRLKSQEFQEHRVGGQTKIYLPLKDHNLQEKMELRDIFETIFERLYPKTQPQYRPHADVSIEGEKLFITGISLPEFRELIAPAQSQKVWNQFF